jgi:hypothetical protein
MQLQTIGQWPHLRLTLEHQFDQGRLSQAGLRLLDDVTLGHAGITLPGGIAR